MMARIMKYGYLLAVLATLQIAAQQNSLVTNIDKKKNKIGAQFNLTLRATADTASVVTFPSGKMLGPMEVIRNYKVDTIKKDNRYELVKKYGLTQFDSGKYTIPSLRVLIGKKEFRSDSIKVEVANVAVDTLKQKMFDIKSVQQGNGDSKFWWILLIAIICLALIGYGIFKYIKTRKPKDAVEFHKSPIEKATVLLQQLEKKELWQKGEVKHYYSELTDIARTYIEEAIHIPAMESTTSELIVALRAAAVKKKMALNPETVENLERVLMQADLVKFAKSKPLDSEIAEDRKRIENSIVRIDSAIPIVVDDEEPIDTFHEIVRQQKLKRQKRQRLIGAIAFVSAFVIFFFIGLVATRGLESVKNSFFGDDAQELLEGEWISSEYGNPGVRIETPKVLKRVDAEKFYPKDVMAALKEFQMFVFNEEKAHFMVMVSTNTFKGEVQLDLSKAIQGGIRTMEARGAKNLIVKQDEYSTKEGIQGMKAYGTATMPDPITKNDVKVYYEIMVFGQQNGIQQIIVIHEDGDKAAEEISERILNSVELKVIPS